MKIEFEYWILDSKTECYDNYYVVGEGATEEQCLINAMEIAPRSARKFKKYKVIEP